MRSGASGSASEEPEWQDCKIAALAHPFGEVRAAAASVLLWDEPVRAEAALQSAAHDNDQDVGVAAIDTLQYYLSRSKIADLDNLARDANDERAATARSSLSTIRSEFLSAFVAASGEPVAQDRLRVWMEPVWDRLAFTPDELHSQPEAGSSAPGPSRRRGQAPPPTDQLIATYAGARRAVEGSPRRTS
jgi:hypothetical protein